MINVRVSDTWVTAQIVEENVRTIWVALPDGHIIKRHRIKHAMADYVVPEPEEIATDGYLHVYEPSWWRRLLNWLFYW